MLYGAYRHVVWCGALFYWKQLEMGDDWGHMVHVFDEDNWWWRVTLPLAYA